MRYFKQPLRLIVPALLAFLLSTQSGNAQHLLGFTPNTLSGWPDTAYVGDSMLVAGLVRNFSANDTFTPADTLYFQGTVDTGSGPIPFSVPYYLPITIAPQDTQAVFIAFRFDTSVVGAPQFHVGNNVVVVWPIGVGPGNWQARDSMELRVFIVDTLSSIGGEPPPGGFVRIYPVPANGPLTISSYHPQYHITHVIVRDITGREVYNGVPTGPINTDAWSAGVFTVEAALSNGTVSWYKIMRQ